jgi:hypothetical protein
VEAVGGSKQGYDPLGGEPAAGRSRRHVLKLAVAAGGGLLLGGTAIERMLGATRATPSATQDRQILNYALLLEYLQAAFYKEGLARAHLRGDLRHFAEVVAGHEEAHVAYLKKALGPKARPSPAFHFGQATRSAKRFAATAQVLEDAGVAAYNGQAANLTKPTLGAAVKIVSVEGRHAAWIRDIVGLQPAPHAADSGSTAPEMTAKLKSLGFVR